MGIFPKAFQTLIGAAIHQACFFIAFRIVNSIIFFYGGCGGIAHGGNIDFVFGGGRCRLLHLVVFL